MGIDKCPVCGDYATLKYHECNPMFQVQIRECEGLEDHEEWTMCRGIDAEDAAIEYVKACDYSCAGDDEEQVVEVRPWAGGDIEKFRVRGWMEATYMASATD